MMESIAMIGCDEVAMATSLRQSLIEKGFRVDVKHVVPLKDLTTVAVLENPGIILAVIGNDLSGNIGMLRELSMTSSAYLVAIGPMGDSKGFLRAMQAGVQDYIEIEQLENSLNDTIGRFRSRRPVAVQESTGADIWGVIGASGGVGCSTLALNIATTLGKRRAEGLLLEFRSVSDAAIYLSVKARHTLDDLLASWSKLDDNLYQRILTATDRGFSLLKGGENSSQVYSGITDALVRRILSFSRKRHPWIVMDIGGIEHPAMREAAIRCNRLVVAVRRDFVSLTKAKGLLDQLASMGFEKDQIVVIANLDGEPGQLSVRESEELLGRSINMRLPYASRAHLTAMHAGTPLVASQPWSLWSWRLSDWVGKNEIIAPKVRS